MNLMEICELIVDCPHSTAKDEKYGYPLVRTPNIGKGRLLLDNVYRVSEEVYNERNKRAIPQKNDLILAREAPVGNVAIIKEGQNVCLGQRTVLIRPNKEKVNPDYLVYYLLSPGVQYRFLNASNGATVSHLNMSDIRNLEIEVPDISIQNKIGKFLSLIDDKISDNYKINKNLEQQAQAIFKSWFVDFEPFDGKQPNTWRSEKLGDVCNCVLGGTPSRAKPEYWNGTIPWINSCEVNNFRIIKPSETITDLGLSKSATKLLPAKTTVIAITGATLGQVSLLEIDACANQSVVGIIPNSNYPYEYIYPLIKENINQLISHQTGGAQQHINKQNVESLDILVPDTSDLGKYRSTVCFLYEMIANNCFENERLVTLRDTLLPKLMSGELDISAVEL